jgi:proliferating cell nuclear antigen PCNA
MKLKVKNDNLETFKGFMNLAKTVLHEDTSMHVSEDGITMMGMDPSHVAMIIASAKPSLFEEYDFDKEEDVCFNIAEFLKFLDRMQKDENVEISVDKEQAKIIIRGKKAGWQRRFTITLLEPLEEEVPTPKITFKSSARIVTLAIDRAIKDAGLVSEHMTLQIGATRLIAKAQGDLGSADSEWDKASDEILDLKGEEESTATFTISTLRDIVVAMRPLADAMRMELSTDMPIMIEMEPKSSSISATLYLAPCIGV